MKTAPYNHQRQCLERHGNDPAFALTAEMGTGKTWIIMANAVQLYTTGELDAMLVFAPNGVHTNWTVKELPTHMPENIGWAAAAWGGKAIEQKEFLRLMKPMNTLRIITMNWEALGTEKGLRAAIKFCESTTRLMIACDESDNIKNPKALRTKALMRLRCYSRWRRIMTGTPFDGTPFSAFSQYNFLDTNILKCSSYTAFKNEYAEILPSWHPLIQAILKKGARFAPQMVATDKHGNPKYKNLDKLGQLIAPYTFRVLKKDCLDLPEKIYKTVLFELTPKQRAVYKKAENECRLEFGGDESAFTKLVIENKLCQITSGYYLHPSSPDEPVRIEGPNPKMDILVDRVRSLVESGEQCIVWARYTIQIQDIYARLKEEGIESVTYYGETKRDARTQAREDFEAGRVKVFVGNQQAGGSGITLIAASYVIYFSNNWSFRDRLQSEDRAHRIGQTKNVTYINIVARKTKDEEVVERLISKHTVSEIIQAPIERGSR